MSIHATPVTTALLAAAFLAWAPVVPAQTAATLWSIGAPDGTSAEFASRIRRPPPFVVGQSAAGRDFAASQDGWVGGAPRAEGARAIVFDLPGTIGPRYELDLDLIFTAAAPSQFQIKVNDQTGIFPIRPAPKHSVWGEQGNEIMLAQQHLVVPIDGAWLKPKQNQITLLPLGLGSLQYDALAFRPATAAPETTPRLEPTVFFRRSGGALMERCNVVLPFGKRFAGGEAKVSLGGQSFRCAFTNSYDFGVLTEPIQVPADLPPGKVKLEIRCDGELLQGECDFKPAKQWKAFVCAKVHNDIGYSDLHPIVAELNNRNTDKVLGLLAEYPFYKFTLETGWLAERYLDSRTGPSREQFFTDLSQGRLAVNAFYLNLLTGVCTGEELYRSLSFTHRLYQQHGGRFESACLTDVPSASWFLPTLLSDAGIKGFAQGGNQARAPMLHYSNLNEDSPFWWEGLSGERVLMVYARAYGHLEILVGHGREEGPAQVAQLERSLPQFLVPYLREDYAPDAVMIYGTYEDNTAIPGTGEAKTIAAWNREFEFPKLVAATDADYFNYIEKHFAGKLPVHRGDGGAYWEDGVASTARPTAVNRQTQQLLPAAETAAALAALFDPRDRYPVEDFRSAWRNVLFYDEHTWGSYRAPDQPGRQFVERQWEIKESHAKRANLDARDLLAGANNRLAQQIALEGSSILAFNWQNRPRPAPLEVELGSGEQLVDLADNQPVPLDVYFERDRWRKVRFLATNVPALGYKAYGIRSQKAASLKPNETLAGPTIESPFYRLTVDQQTGGIQSLFDKTEQRELADAKAPWRLNEYLYVSGGEGSKRGSLLLNCTFAAAPAELDVHRPGPAAPVNGVKTPLGQRFVAQSKGRNTPSIRSEYLLYDQLKRVDIINTVEKEEVRAKEAVYFAFPFAAEKPGLEYQIQNGWVRPNEDQLPGACREWFASQNLVHVSDGPFSVAWSAPDAPLVTFEDINRGLWLSHLSVTNGHVYSYLMNNYWYTNYRGQQGGTFVFRYFITSGRNLTREDLAHFDADTRAPVLAHPHLSSFTSAIAQTGRPMPPGGGSFLGLDAPNLEIVTLKQAEDGDGFILRFREIAGRAGEAELRCPVFRLREAHLCNGVEENKQRLAASANAVKVPYQPNQFTTVRLKPER